MKILVLISAISLAFNTVNEPELGELRLLFYRSAIDRSAAAKFSELVANVDRNSTPLLMCYRGVAEMMQAKHGLNPLNKLSKFNSGKDLIEESITRDPENLELRFLRFSIQSNLPAFLGYKDDIQLDKLKLLTGLGQLKDMELKEKIIAYLAASKYCTAADLKRLKS